MKELSIEDTELLFKDLSQRLPCKVKCNVYDRIGTLTGLNDYGAEIDYGNGEDTTCEIKYCLPYLRPMSSMTEEEKEELNCLCYHNIGVQDNMLQGYLCGSEINDVIDWLISHHFDYRTDDEGKTMIENGLAIEVTENNNPYK
jgi:hypothetical protein